MNLRVIGVFKLLGDKNGGVLLCAPAHFLNGSGDALFGRCKNQLGAKRSDDLFPLLAHIFRHDYNNAVAFLDAGQGQANAGVARGGLHYGHPGLQSASFLRLLDHVEGYPVFYATARI